MPSPIRALVVAENAAARRFVWEMLDRDACISVVGAAPTAKIALSKIALLRPDVVTLAPEMPDEGALEMVQALRQSSVRTPVVLFSCRNGGSDAANRLLTQGANAFVGSPGSADRASIERTVREALIPRIKSLCSPLLDRSTKVEIVAIGVSTGGPNALPVVLSSLPPQLPVPVLIVQHMPPVFTRQLAERLNAKSGHQVQEAVRGARLQAGQVWLAPGDYHLVVGRDAAGTLLDIHQGPQENSCRPSVDTLFRSVAEIFGSSSLGLVMTGMGRDGLKGAEALRAAGGQVVIQDEATSVVWGMPGAAWELGAAESKHALADIPAQIMRLLNESGPAFRAVGAAT